MGFFFRNSGVLVDRDDPCCVAGGSTMSAGEGIGSVRTGPGAAII